MCGGAAGEWTGMGRQRQTDGPIHRQTRQGVTRVILKVKRKKLKGGKAVESMDGIGEGKSNWEAKESREVMCVYESEGMMYREGRGAEIARAKG